MDKFCTITCDRGDRPELMEFCKHQLERMTIKPDHSYFIDYPPEDSKKDLIARMKKGIEQAKADGFEKIYVIESDDYYCKDYFERFQLNGEKITGASSTLCYNLRFNSFQQYGHPERSSLFHTAFHISVFDHFTWPDPDNVFLDLRLWKYAKRNNIPSRLITEPIAIAMKHNIGIVGGKGHVMNYEKKDPDRSYLKSIVDSEAYAFYQSLKV